MVVFAVLRCVADYPKPPAMPFDAVVAPDRLGGRIRLDPLKLPGLKHPNFISAARPPLRRPVDANVYPPVVPAEVSHVELGAVAGELPSGHVRLDEIIRHRPVYVRPVRAYALHMGPEIIALQCYPAGFLRPRRPRRKDRERAFGAGIEVEHRKSFKSILAERLDVFGHLHRIGAVVLPAAEPNARIEFRARTGDRFCLVEIG